MIWSTQEEDDMHHDILALVVQTQAPQWTPYMYLHVEPQGTIAADKHHSREIGTWTRKTEDQIRGLVIFRPSLCEPRPHPFLLINL